MQCYIYNTSSYVIILRTYLMQLAVSHFDCLHSWDVFTFNVPTNFNNIYIIYKHYSVEIAIRKFMNLPTVSLTILKFTLLFQFAIQSITYMNKYYLLT